jgi:hypothetical protein
MLCNPAVGDAFWLVAPREIKHKVETRQAVLVDIRQELRSNAFVDIREEHRWANRLSCCKARWIF